MGRTYGCRIKSILKSLSVIDDKTLLIVVAAALIDDAGRVLVQQRPPGASMAGLWEFPGGKVEAGETPEAALIRELREELGIGIADFTPMDFASESLGDRHLLLLLYLCRAWQGTPVALHASELRWMLPHQLYDLPMPPADRPLIVSIAAVAQGVCQ